VWKIREPEKGNENYRQDLCCNFAEKERKNLRQTGGALSVEEKLLTFRDDLPDSVHDCRFFTRRSRYHIPFPRGRQPSPISCYSHLIRFLTMISKGIISKSPMGVTATQDENYLRRQDLKGNGMKIMLEGIPLSILWPLQPDIRSLYGRRMTKTVKCIRQKGNHVIIT